MHEDLIEYGEKTEIFDPRLSKFECSPGPNHGEGAIKAQVGFNLRFDAISRNRENFDFNHLH